MNHADVILYILDYSKLKTEEEAQILQKMRSMRPDLIKDITNRLFVVVNKMDLVKKVWACRPAVPRLCPVRALLSKRHSTLLVHHGDSFHPLGTGAHPSSTAATTTTTPSAIFPQKQRIILAVWCFAFCLLWAWGHHLPKLSMSQAFLLCPSHLPAKKSFLHTNASSPAR